MHKFIIIKNIGTEIPNFKYFFLLSLISDFRTGPIHPRHVVQNRARGSARRSNRKGVVLESCVCRASYGTRRNCFLR
jgi:hypothetical protein